MLDKLPTELLLRTLELATPLDYSVDFHFERKKLLRNCCLVSKILGSVAQPMLPEVFRVSEPSDIAKLQVATSGGKRGDQVKLLVFKPEESYTYTNDEDEDGKRDEMIGLADMVSLVPALTELRLIGWEDYAMEYDLSLLATLPCTSFPSDRSLVLTSASRSSPPSNHLRCTPLPLLQPERRLPFPPRALHVQPVDRC
jgi:hypothetical protein